jgi:hypothetical protein
MNQGAGGVCNTYYYSRSESTKVERSENICREHRAKYTHNNRVVGKECTTLDTTVRGWEPTGAVRVGREISCNNGRCQEAI